MMVILLIISILLVSEECLARHLMPRPSAQAYGAPGTFLVDSLPEKSVLPKLIVFDLDHTLWTPELFSLKIPDEDRPIAGQDVWLLPDAFSFLYELSTHPRWQRETAIGVASRTHRTSFAHHLLNTMEIKGQALSSIVQPGCTQIYRGNKQRHFKALREATSLEYHEMLFFDDARDGKYGNCEPVSELGVMSCHCPRGLTLDIVENAITTYDRTMRSTGPEGVGHIVDAPRIGGTKKGGTIGVDEVDVTKMRVFSMNQPFASLLAHGVKQLETRNGTMFASNTKPGDQMALHVGQRIYPDGGEHIEILRESGYTPAQIGQLTSLPKGFQKGQVVAVLELGETVLVEDEGLRSKPEIERASTARGPVMGRYLTSIRRVKWMKKGFKTKGQPGIFSADVPTRLLPELDINMKETVKQPEQASEQPVVPANYTWEGGGGTDVCASALNDDPFDAEEERVDQWKLFKQRVDEKIKADPNFNQEAAGSGRWP